MENKKETDRYGEKQRKTMQTERETRSELEKETQTDTDRECNRERETAYDRQT